MKSALRPQITVLMLSLGALLSNNVSAITPPVVTPITCTLTAFDEGKADGNAYRVSVLHTPNGTELIAQQVTAAQSAATANPSTARYFEGYVAGLEPSRELTSLATVRGQ